MCERIFLRLIAPLLGAFMCVPRRRKEEAFRRSQFLELKLGLWLSLLCGSSCLYSEGVAQARLGFLGLLCGRRIGR